MGKKPTDSTTPDTTPKTDPATREAEEGFRQLARMNMAGHVAQGLIERENIDECAIPGKVRTLTDAIMKELDK